MLRDLPPQDMPWNWCMVLFLRHIELEVQGSPDAIEEGMASAFTLLNADKVRHADRIKEMKKAV